MSGDDEFEFRIGLPPLRGTFSESRPLGHLVTGYSVKAMERKIERGDWIEGKEWVRAPDGRVMLDVLGYEKWAGSRYR